MSQPTKEQWDEIARQLDRMYDAVCLRCDDYLITASLMRADKNKLKIVVYVDGSIQGKWCQVVEDANELSEEPRRFWFHSKHQKIAPKTLKAWERAIGKRECRKRGYYNKMIVPRPDWNSANSFIRHLRRHNANIEVLTRDEYNAALDAKRGSEA